MENIETVEAKIVSAFATVEYPGDWCLRGSNEGDEPYLLDKDFAGRSDWRTLEPSFLDQAPDGYGSALSFFSDEAFRFYLPAYMIADLHGDLQLANPVHHLTHGLYGPTRLERVNPRRYGDRTWLDCARYKFSVFSKAQAAAIVAYLSLRRDTGYVEVTDIDEALTDYWNERQA